MRSWWSLPFLLSCTAAPVDVPVDTDVPADAIPYQIDEVPLTQHVDPMLGSEGSGNTIPGALVPHGMVRLSPDTLNNPGAIAAYEWNNTHIEGFTHTHLEGPGGSLNGYSQVLVLPQTGPLEVEREARAALYSHDTEVARPGYYAVDLTDDDVTVELTATGHAAMHRVHFPAGPARLLLDLGHSAGTSVNGSLQLDGATITGSGEYNVHPIASMATLNDGRTAYTELFVWAEASIEPTDVGTLTGRDPIAHPGEIEASGAWTAGWIGWDFDEPTTVELRIGLSYIDVDQARTNADVQLGDATFDEIVERADIAWNSRLNRVQVDASPEDLTKFYTALYRTFFQPADHTEPGGRYMIGTSGERLVVEEPDLHFLTSDWCMWDTYRTSHPLKTLIEPELYDDIITSMVRMYEHGGWLPKCTWSATGYSRVMIGNHAVPIIADGYVKGLDGFDVDRAWEAIDKTSTQDMDDLPDGACGYVNLGTPPDYLELGYVPHECDPTQAASMTMEYAQDDFAAAAFAERAGRTEDAARYSARSTNWRAHWDPSVGFVRGKRRDGTWVEPFDPADSSDTNNFVEASAWIFSFHIPHDVPGMIDVHGGDLLFRDKLDQFFADDHFDPSNQPSFHVPWLYAHAGSPAQTQSRVREIVEEHYDVTPGGLPGNDDAGSTSAWLVYAMLGMYPVSPGDPTYTLAAPMLQEATVHLHPGLQGGGTFTVRAEGDLTTQPYVASATLNGQALDVPFLSHEDIIAGGELVFVMSETATTWGE